MRGGGGNDVQLFCILCSMLNMCSTDGHDRGADGDVCCMVVLMVLLVLFLMFAAW